MDRKLPRNIFAIGRITMHEFVILLNGEKRVYNNFEDIPMKFDNLLKFKPVHIPGPHTEEEHEINSQWTDKLLELMKRETR